MIISKKKTDGEGDGKISAKKCDDDKVVEVDDDGNPIRDADEATSTKGRPQTTKEAKTTTGPSSRSTRNFNVNSTKQRKPPKSRRPLRRQPT